MGEKNLIWLVLIPFTLMVYAAVQLHPSFGKSEREPSHEPVAVFNGSPVGEDEFRLIFQKYRDKEQSLEALVRIKAIQHAAAELELIPSASYSDFLNEWKSENERRQTALERGELVFGPQRYSLANYYDHRQAELVNRLKENLFAVDDPTREEELQAYFKANMERLGKRHDTIVLLRIVEPIEADQDSSYGHARQEALQRITGLQREIEEEEDFQSLFDLQISKFGREPLETIDELNYREISKYRSSYYQAALQLREGEVSAVIEDVDGFVIMMCVSREGGGYIGFHESRTEVEARYVDDLFEQYVDKWVRETEVELLPLFGAFNR